MQHPNKKKKKAKRKRWCNTTTNALSGLSAVNSQYHVPMLLNHTDACTQTQCSAQTHTDSPPLSSTSSWKCARATHTLPFTHIFWDQRKSWLQHFSPLQKSSQCQNDKWGIMWESVHTYIRLHKSLESCVNQHWLQMVAELLSGCCYYTEGVNMQITSHGSD